MKVSLIAALSGLFIAGAAHAQTAPAQDPEAEAARRAAESLTDDLNAPPPGVRNQAAPARTPPPAPAPSTTSVPAPVQAPPPQPVRTAPPPAPTTQTPPPAQTAPTAPARQDTPPPAPPQPSSPPPPVTPPPAPAEAAPPVSAPPRPVPVSSLPFNIDLPPGFRVEASVRGDAASYTIYRGERLFVIVYDGAQSQFPVYDGRMVERGGRTSMIVTDNGRDRAMEHLFRDPTSLRELHIMVSYVPDEDAPVADAIAQSIDPK